MTPASMGDNNPVNTLLAPSDLILYQRANFCHKVTGIFLELTLVLYALRLDSYFVLLQEI